jgi:hypothetical protein
MASASHALIYDLRNDRLAVQGDGDLAATVRVSVGLGTHEAVGEGDDVLVFSVAQPAASTNSGVRIVVRDFASAWAALCTFSAVRAGVGCWSRFYGGRGWFDGCGRAVDRFRL